MSSSMCEYPVLVTPRLVLRAWRDSDLEPFAATSADPQVTEFLGVTMTRSESDAHARRLREHFEKHGFGKWVVEAPGVAGFVGVVGLAWVDFPAPFTPCVEVGWRLAYPHWGKGYATEAAGAALRFGFEELRLREILTFTTPNNQRSRSVMERLGMRYCPGEEFDHPKLPPEHPLRRHVLYRLSDEEWRARTQDGG